jgi:mono/diheme cytochrome c family protein
MAQAMRMSRIMRNVRALAAYFVTAFACSGSGVAPVRDSASPHPRVGTTTTPAAANLPRILPVEGTGAGSSVLIARVDDRTVAYVADSDDTVIRAIDAETLREIAVLDVAGSPAQLVMGRGGGIFATIRDRNILLRIEGAGTEGAPMRVAARVRTPVEPIGIALTPDEATVLVASGWGHALSGFETTTLKERFREELGREPRAVVASDDGERAFVSHAIGSDLDVVDLRDPEHRTRVSMKAKESLSEGRFFAGEFDMRASQGFALARSVAPAGRVFAPHARVRPMLVRSEEAATHYGSPEFGPTEEFDVGVLDEDKGTALAQSLNTQGGTACVLPRAAASTGEGQLLVACVGTSEIVALDAAAVNPHQAVTGRWKVPSGPMGIAVDPEGRRALVWSQFAHALTWIALAGNGSLVMSSTTLPRRAQPESAFEKGRELFHSSDVRVSEDGRACASCHPDGRDDGLVWSTPDGPRNPPMLAGRLDHAAPYGWLGNSADVPGHLKKTLARLGGTGLANDDRDALVQYVRTMPAPPVDAPKDAGLLDEGERIFESDRAACSSCHGTRGASPDGLTHNIGSWAQGDIRGIFDTPSLRFVAGTAPYFHDGRYDTLHSLLTHIDGFMGHTAQLTPHELDALEAYLRSL